MTKYAEIYNDTVLQVYSELPKAWKNISGFNALSNLELSNLDWSGTLGYKFYVYSEAAKPNVDTDLYHINGPIRSIAHSEKKVYGTWSTSPVLESEAWSVIRTERTQRLYACDWTQLPDAPLTTQQKADWATYRQALRDITNQPDPFNLTWPTEPVT
jgi:hypothetical protein